MAEHVRGAIIPRNEILNTSHPKLVEVSPHADVQIVEFNGLTPAACEQLLRITKDVYPRRYRPKFRKEAQHRHATIVTPKEEESREHELGIFFSAGLGSTAPGIATTVTNLYETLERKPECDVGIVAGFSSSVSFDTNNQSFPSKHTERAAVQAAYVVELLKKHPVKDLLLMGHSFSAMEFVYMYPVLKRLLQENNMDTKLLGMVFLQGSGFFKQRVIPFAKQELDFMSMRAEIVHMFPNIYDLYDLMPEIDIAWLDGDMDRVGILERTLSTLREKYIDPKNLRPEQLERKRYIDRQLEAIRESDNADNPRAKQKRSKKAKRLLRKRNRLLKPAVGDYLNGADARGKNLFPLKTQWRAVRGNVVRTSNHVTSMLPSWARRYIDVPAVFVFAKDDDLFPGEKAIKGISDFEREQQQKVRATVPYAVDGFIEREGRYFPNAPKQYIAEVRHWPHAAIITNPEKSGEILEDITARLLRDSKEPSEYLPTEKLHY